MTKPKLSAPPSRQIAPPPLSQHLREFASWPHAWVVLARNLFQWLGFMGSAGPRH
jgi:hypothetical protein